MAIAVAGLGAVTMIGHSFAVPQFLEQAKVPSAGAAGVHPMFGAAIPIILGYGRNASGQPLPSIAIPFVADVRDFLKARMAGDMPRPLAPHPTDSPTVAQPPTEAVAGVSKAAGFTSQRQSQGETAPFPARLETVLVAPDNRAAPVPNSIATPVPILAALPADTAQSASRYRQFPDGIEVNVGVRMNGASAGKLSLWIEEGVVGETDTPSSGFRVRAGDVLEIVKPRMEPASYKRLASSAPANDYVSLNELRVAGIAINFDDKDRLILDTKGRSARSKGKRQHD